jgi:hypothetical protein
MLQNFLSHAPWLQIVVAGIAYFAIGALWYSVLFGKAWQAGHGIQMTEESKKRAPMIMGLTVVINLLMAVSTAFLVYGMQSTTVMSALKVGLFISLSYSASVTAINYLYLGKSLKLWFIDAFYHVVGITVMTIILSLWR